MKIRMKTGFISEECFGTNATDLGHTPDALSLKTPVPAGTGTAGL